MRQSIVAVFALMSALSLPPKSLASDSKGCGLTQYASLDLLEGPHGRLLVPVTMQGTAGFMVLDAEAGMSTVTESAAALLGLRVKPAPVDTDFTIGRHEVRKIATAEGVSLGGARFKMAKFLVRPAAENASGMDDPKLFGFLGMDLFEHVDVELDLANHKLNLFSQDHCPGHVVYWSKTYGSAPISFGVLGELYFPMELDGKKVEATLDTLDAHTNLSTDVTRALFHFDSDSSDVETETTATGQTIAHYRAM